MPSNYISRGYIYIYMPDHPGATSAGYVAEHRLIAEQVIGRLISPDEIVHHINNVKGDNRPDNLQVMTQAEHARLHGFGNTHQTDRKGTRWAIDHDACIRCGTNERRHIARGMCEPCYKRITRIRGPKIERWSKHSPSCVSCGTSERRHRGIGLCTRCYERLRIRHH